MTGTVMSAKVSGMPINSACPEEWNLLLTQLKEQSVDRPSGEVYEESNAECAKHD